MLISHRYRFIFLKTTKTAGTSTELFFQPACMAPSAEPLDWRHSHSQLDELVTEYGVVGVRGRRSGEETFYNHMPAKRVVAVIGADMWQDYFRFANVRNPWDKVVSLYFFSEDWRLPDGSVPDRSTIIGRIEEFAVGRRRPEVENFLAPAGPHISDVVRYEQLEDDIRRIAAVLAYDGGGEVPRLKTDTRPAEYRDYRLVCSDLVRESVAELYADWIDEYGYRF
jgi:hypothetical protein